LPGAAARNPPKVLLSQWGLLDQNSPEKYPMSALIAQQAGAFGIDWPRMMAFAGLRGGVLDPGLRRPYRQLPPLCTGLTLGAVK